MRTLWATLPLTLGPLLSDALATRSGAVRATMLIGMWAGWGLVLFACFLPRVETLTPVRALVPLPAAAAVWATAATSLDGTAALGLSAAIAVTAVAFSALAGDAFIDGSSYGDERRFALRPQAILLAGPIPLVWVAGAAGLVSGPLLLAARQWIAGAIAVVFGAAAAYLAYRALAALAQRWLVLVPAGVVLRDHLALAEPTLFPRASIERVGPTPRDDVGLDLTAGAPGLALQLRFREPVPVAPAPRRGAIAEPVAVTALSFAPSRPGAVLAEARKRRIPIG